jgi:prepilin-type N-terminal cleavage/methylation domain-containing protein
MESGRRKMNLNQKGFSLLELLIGLVILAIGILAITGMQITSIRGTSFSNRLSQASVIAQEGLESLKGVTINDARLNTGDYNEPDVGIFQRSYRSDRNPEFVTLRYAVSWVEEGSTRSVSFSTIKSR